MLRECHVMKLLLILVHLACHTLWSLERRQCVGRQELVCLFPRLDSMFLILGEHVIQIKWGSSSVNKTDSAEVFMKPFDVLLSQYTMRILRRMMPLSLAIQ